MGKRDILWYNSPAEVWTDALPLGNGKLGDKVLNLEMKKGESYSLKSLYAR